MLLLAFLLPLAVYLLVLAQINRRLRPWVVSGPWDFAGILFAASGFLLLGGPAILSSLTLTEHWRRFWLLGKDFSPTAQEERLRNVRVGLFAIYFVLVVAAAAFVLWRRRKVTAIYNVDSTAVERLLEGALEQGHVSFVQTGNTLYFAPDNGSPPPLSDAPNEQSPLRERGQDSKPGETPLVERVLPSLVDYPASLEVDVSPALCHVTLRWHPPNTPLRKEVEAQLRRGLARTPAPDSGVGDWMLIIACGLLFLVLAGTTVLLLLSVSALR